MNDVFPGIAAGELDHGRQQINQGNRAVDTEEEETIVVKGMPEPVRTYLVSGLYDDLTERGRVIRHDSDGLSLLIDRDKLSAADRAVVIAALEAAVAQLKS